MSNVTENSQVPRGFETLTPADGDLYWFCQKKRPALPETRALMLELIREHRDGIDAYAHANGTPLTKEERWKVRQMTHEIRRIARAHLLEAERQIEAMLWQTLMDIGCLPKGGLQ